MYRGSNVQSFGFTDDAIWFNVKLGKNANFTELITRL
jgi:hypothetical protein